MAVIDDPNSFRIFVRVFYTCDVQNVIISSYLNDICYMFQRSLFLACPSLSQMGRNVLNRKTRKGGTSTVAIKNFNQYPMTS